MRSKYLAYLTDMKKMSKLFIVNLSNCKLIVSKNKNHVL